MKKNYYAITKAMKEYNALMANSNTSNDVQEQDNITQEQDSITQEQDSITQEQDSITQEQDNNSSVGMDEVGRVVGMDKTVQGQGDNSATDCEMLLENGTKEDSLNSSFTSVNNETIYSSLITERSENASSKSDLAAELKHWALIYNVRANALTDLLKLLQKFNITNKDMPIDSRTLLNTRRNIEKMKLSDDSEIHHFGLRNGIISCLSGISVPDEVAVTINIDGLPLFKSSRINFWPILGCIQELGKRPFVITLHCGKHKPPVHEFLKPFIDEYTNLQIEGIAIGNKKIAVKIVAFVCDAPARAYIKQCKAHNALHGCEKCTAIATRINNTTSFPVSIGPLRTDDGFKNQTDPLHHNGISPLLSININMITMFPIDYMHNICLGIMKKLLVMWTSLIPHKISSGAKAAINLKLKYARKWVPLEFARKQRQLEEVDRWKAVEFRMFLLYIGPVVLKELGAAQYRHFMLLSTAVMILCSDTLCGEPSLVDYAEKLLRNFVSKFTILYRGSKIVYNLHTLLHVPDDVRNFGALDNFSAFRYESYLGIIKRKIRHGNSPLSQACLRIYEMQDANESLIKNNLKYILLNGKIIPGRKENSCVTLNDGGIGFINSVEDEICEFEELKVTGNLYDYPCKSSRFGIWKCTISNKVKHINYDEIDKKCFVISVCRNIYYVIPLIHFQ